MVPSISATPANNQPYFGKKLIKAILPSLGFAPPVAEVIDTFEGTKKPRAKRKSAYIRNKDNWPRCLGNRELGTFVYNDTERGTKQYQHTIYNEAGRIATRFCTDEPITFPNGDAARKAFFRKRHIH